MRARRPLPAAHRQLAPLPARARTLNAACCPCTRSVYLNGRNEGKHGVEAIPHIRYWEEVPGLVRDGLQFSYVHGKAYSEIALEKGKVVYEAMRSKYTSLNQTPS